jgi:hypothetical protein
VCAGVLAVEKLVRSTLYTFMVTLHLFEIAEQQRFSLLVIFF